MIKIKNGIISEIVTLQQNDDLSNGLIIGSDGYLYGTICTSAALVNKIFKVAKDGSGYATLHNFATSLSPVVPYPEGAAAYYGLLEHNGRFYGTCFSYGATLGNTGTIYSVNMDGSSFTKLYD